MEFSDVYRAMVYGGNNERKASGDPPKRASQLLSTQREAMPILDAAAEHENLSLRLDAAAAVNQWLEDDDLEAGETSADRLRALMVGVVDSSQDGELDDDEYTVLDAVLESAWDYLDGLGVDEADISALLNDWDEGAAERIRDVAALSLDDSDLAALDHFAFSEEDQGSIFDATYRKKLVVRGGKKMRVNKRVAGNVRLSAKQKVAIKKARLKSQSAAAKAHRLKSMQVRKRMGL